MYVHGEKIKRSPLCKVGIIMYFESHNTGRLTDDEQKGRDCYTTESLIPQMTCFIPLNPHGRS